MLIRWSRLWSVLTHGCPFGHARDPIYARDDKGRAIWECRRCQQPIARILPKQKLKVRPSAPVVAFPKRKRA